MSLKEKFSDICCKQDYKFSRESSSQSMLVSASSECDETESSTRIPDLKAAVCPTHSYDSKQDYKFSRESSSQSMLVSANITCDKEESSTPTSDLKAAVHSTHSYKGVEYSMVSPVPEDLTCAVCHELLNDPHQTECGHLFCRVCLEKSKDIHPQNMLRSPPRNYYRQTYKPQSTFTCPVCRSRCGSEGFEDKHVDRHVKSLAIQCDNEPCPWEGTLGRLEDHKSGREGCRACQYEEVECSLGCGEEMRRKDLDHHCQSVCQLRPQKCKHCRWLGTSQTIGNHYRNCTEYPLQCPNECGKSGILKRAMQSHLDKCQEHSVSCPYKDLGCLVTVKRRLLSEHTQEAKDRHLQLALERVCQLSRIVMESSLRVPSHQSLCTPWLCNTAEFPAMPWIVRLDNFSSRKVKRAVEWLSEPVYTEMSGYRFRIEVYAGGDFQTPDYISVYCLLHRGPNDSILSWPFKGTVKVTLLNQLEDRFHHVKTVNYANLNGSDCINEITESEQSTRGSGCGCSNFIKHSQLDKKQYQSCQYLKDDCLFLKVELV